MTDTPQEIQSTNVSESGKPQGSLLDVLKTRLTLSKEWTKQEFIDDTDRAVSDYEFKDDTKFPVSNSTAALKDTINRRYEFPTPLIFTNTESYKASLFDRPLDIMVKAEGASDADKKQTVVAAYQYLKKKLDLDTLQTEAAHWFVLSGFISAYTGYKKDGYEAPMLDDMGQPMIGQDGQPSTTMVYTYDDPIVQLLDYKCAYYSPEAKFSTRGEQVPYVFYKKMMTKEDVKRIYEVDEEADESLEVKSGNKDKDESSNKELARVPVYFYFGSIPSDCCGEEYEEGSDYYIVMTKSHILYSEKLEEKNVRFGRWHSTPNKFFGFGTGKLGRHYQLEKSIRRGQEVRMADLQAFPKLAVPDGVEIDEAQWLDPRAVPVVTWNSTVSNQRPEFLQPPKISEAVGEAINRVDQDAQQTFGLLDISQGGQNSTVVKTATGQSIFADAAEKRVRFAKRLFVGWYKQIVIDLLKQAQKNWDEEKVVKILDEETNEYKNVSLTKESLEGIDFDSDIDIDVESTSTNKDLEREQMISLYDKVKDDPLVNREEVLKDVMKNGFGVKNPDKYLRKSNLQPGQQLVDPATGEQFVVDETGELVPAQDMQELGTPTNEAPASSGSALLGSAV